MSSKGGIIPVWANGNSPRAATLAPMLRRTTLLLLLAAAGLGGAQEPDGELTKVKEQELEEVRDRISDLKKSMDAAAMERDRVTGELQDIEVRIAEQRTRIREIERDQAYTESKKQKLDTELADRERHLDAESEALAAQVRAAYMSGNQERIKLLLNQRDPATLGRLMAYYRYLNDYRAENIEAVVEEIRKLDQLRAQIAAESARLEQLARARYDELGTLNAAQEKRQSLLASLRRKIADEGREVDRLAAQEQDLQRLIAELTSILSDYPISSEQPFSALRGKLTWPAGR